LKRVRLAKLIANLDIDIPRFLQLGLRATEIIAPYRQIA
jgi:hypothetical protein